VADVAERTTTGADVAHDHEGRRALAEAFADVRAGGLFADRVQFLAAQDFFDFVKAPVQRRGLHANPVGFFDLFLKRNDLDRDARRLGFALEFDASYFGFLSHRVLLSADAAQ